MRAWPELDDVRWETLEHAYGPAIDVPGLLRGLASDSAAEREVALDGMYGAVHHQGDLYDSTIAALPFLLELLTHVERPGRADVLELVSSIGRSARAGEPSSDDPDPLATRVCALLGAEAGLFEALLADPDVSVRSAAPAALLCCERGGYRAHDVLLARFEREPDASVRREIVSALAVACRRGVDLRGWLDVVARTHPEPSIRVEAATVVLELDPATSVDLDALIDAAYQTQSATRPPPVAETDTLIGTIRRMEAERLQGREAPDAAASVHALLGALGDRVADRTRVIARLLRASNPEMRQDAIAPFTVLSRGWRGDYRELVALLGAELLRLDARERGMVARALRDLFQLAAPAADALAASLAEARREARSDLRDPLAPPWLETWPRQAPTCGPTLLALARCRDARALPILEWVLGRSPLATDVGFVVGDLGPLARPLAPLVLSRLEQLAALEEVRSSVRGGLAYAVRSLGDAAAPAIGTLARLATHEINAIHTLGALGPAAHAGAPALWALLDDGRAHVALAAARALCAIEPDAERLIAALMPRIDEPAALWALGLLGPAAIDCAPLVEARLDSHASACVAYARIHRDVAPVRERIERSWRDEPYARPEIARLAAELGTRAASLRGLIEAELASPRRHAASPHVSSSHEIRDDEQLLQACRDAIAAMDGAPARALPGS